jgi:hypothetical protein
MFIVVVVVLVVLAIVVAIVIVICHCQFDNEIDDCYDTADAPITELHVSLNHQQQKLSITS